MTDSVEKAFEQFAAGLTLPAAQLKVAMGKSDQVNEWARRRLKASGSFFGGSFRRGTALPQESLKFYLLLSQRHFFDSNENSLKMLFFLKKRLTEYFSPVVISEGGMFARLSSADAVDLDLAPAIKLSRDGYLSPNGQGGWFKTNPRQEEIIFKKKEDLSSRRFLNLAKIIKVWSLRAGLPLNSYFLELLVYYRVNDYMKPYAELVHSLLMSMRLFLPEFLNCPAVGEVISSGANSTAVQKILDEVLGIASGALHENDPGRAILLWREILGDGFGAVD